MSATKMKLAAKTKEISDQEIEEIIDLLDRNKYRSLSYLTVIFGSISAEQIKKLAPHLSVTQLQRLKIKFNQIDDSSQTLLLEALGKNPNFSNLEIKLGEATYNKKTLYSKKITVKEPALTSAPDKDGAPSLIESLNHQLNQLMISPEHAAGVKSDLNEVKATLEGAVNAVSEVAWDAIKNAASKAWLPLSACMPSKQPYIAEKADDARPSTSADERKKVKME